MNKQYQKLFRAYSLKLILINRNHLLTPWYAPETLPQFILQGALTRLQVSLLSIILMDGW